MLGDLEFRGHARPATEEFNLAAHYDENDVTRAEVLRTCQSQACCGADLLRRHEMLQKMTVADSSLATRNDDDASPVTVPIRVPAPHPEMAPKPK